MFTNSYIHQHHSAVENDKTILYCFHPPSHLYITERYLLTPWHGSPSTEVLVSKSQVPLPSHSPLSIWVTSIGTVCEERQANIRVKVILHPIHIQNPKYTMWKVDSYVPIYTVHKSSVGGKLQISAGTFLSLIPTIKTNVTFTWPLYRTYYMIIFIQLNLELKPLDKASSHQLSIFGIHWKPQIELLTYADSLFKKPRPPLLYYGSRTNNYKHAQLRMKCSRPKLNFHLYSLHVLDSPACPCGHDREDSNHYLLHCPLYFQARITMLNKIRHLTRTHISCDLLLDMGHQSLTLWQTTKFLMA